MKRLAFFAALCLLATSMTTATFVSAQTREITILMRDSFDDGWDGGAALRVARNGVNLVPNPTIATRVGTSIYTFIADIGDLIEVYWVKGTFDNECAFAFYYSNSPPSPAFNPAATATNNDTENILLSRQYGSLGVVAGGAFLGSFTVNPSISVSPRGITLPTGETQAFVATLIGLNNPDQTVSWSVSGSVNAATFINPTTGVLSIAANETAASLTITATSNAVPTLFGRAIVGVQVPYLRIGTAAELAAFADSINAGRNFTGRLVILTADIDLSVYGADNTAFNSGRGWIPIGSSTTPFRGEFDGNGHVIRGLYINNANRSYAGLFGQIGSAAATGIVRNIGLEDVDINADGSVGGVVGLIRGYGTNVGYASQQDFHSELTNVYVTGRVRGAWNSVGGIAGDVSSWGLVESSYTTAEVSGNSLVGGIAGHSDGEIRDCAALNPSVKGGTSTSSAGRIVGTITTYALLRNNAAYDEMLNRLDNYNWSSKGLTTINGADITVANMIVDGTLGGRFAHAPWVTANGKLPGFGAPVDFPDYISNEPPTVTAVSVTPQNEAAIRGKNNVIQFSATVTGTGRPDQGVTWSVAGGVSSGTAINLSGRLTVTADEEAQFVTVTARSVMDTAISGTARVPVLDLVDDLTPVERNGRLAVSGNRVINEHGETVQLRGMSFFWSMASEGRDYYNANVVNWLADDWKVNVVRAAMGVDEVWIDAATRDTMAGYLSGDNSGGISNKQRVIDVVEAAIARGIYVIIDWHSHQAHLNTSAAREFFEEMAHRYKDVPNVIYEIYNEPEGYTWGTHIRPYSQTIVNAIRAIDPYNIIILGTPQWSQDVDIATANPVAGDNLTYSLHFYAYSHGTALRSKATTALNRNHALFVSEFGTCHANGGSPIDTAATTVWLNFLDQHRISWVNWSIADKAEAASALMPGTRTDGRWMDSDLTLSGRYIRNRLIAAHETEFMSLPRLLTYKAGQHGKIRVGATETLADEYTSRTRPGTNGPQITAVPESGYSFVGWSDGSISNPRQDMHAWANISVTANFEASSSTAAGDREIPQSDTTENAAIITPPAVSAGELTAGPNPTGRQSGIVYFFWHGKQIGSGALTIYDASGNIVNKIQITDCAMSASAESRRIVGSWDLTGRNGRPVSAGAYLAKGVIVTPDGNRERVSLMVGVR
ncbi:MAG: cellulase family glycosylhydrolase [Chitinispirillales bacterium]|jgi:endoglucanase|nr:cellulase family glycosylhydrolase [Chitinispirillales bacterium]